MITNQDVSPDDILVIDLDSINLNDDFNMFKKTLYEKAWNEEDKVWKCKTNLVNKDNAVKFRIKDSIPFTTIFRAKGNEANIVFVVNSHKMRSISSYARNRIFTAMTRARFKVYVLGTKGMAGFIKEAETVKKNNYTLSFCYPTLNPLHIAYCLNNNQTLFSQASKLLVLAITFYSLQKYILLFSLPTHC